MTYNIIILSLFFFIGFLLNSSSAQVIGRNDLYPQCSTGSNFTANSTFDSNLQTLFSPLTSNKTANLDFYNTTVGRGGETVNGLFRCVGPVNQDICRQCVANSILQAGFMNVLTIIMNQTADEASKSAVMKQKFKTNAVVVEFQTMYVLVQCTPDLSSADCRRCLSGVIGDFRWCCDGKIGGRVLYPSCFARYELYRFSNSSTPLLQVKLPPPPALLPGKLHNYMLF
ncbi:cysteine-rich receptor-like protein kinase 6 [Neltuma alba]|uniref:cysteine-rich receptor-like protein kinase 6 n=1 Tax=Neltuma alba TaxID=207710 RepID=UPI0010A41DED|nr:cysteine-rich receptor-like protein kinase 6 [Prosopis alba]